MAETHPVHKTESKTIAGHRDTFCRAVDLPRIFRSPRYAVARATGEPLLYIGNDFARTDIA